jgi:hypothetical protein
LFTKVLTALARYKLLGGGLIMALLAIVIVANVATTPSKKAHAYGLFGGGCSANSWCIVASGSASAPAHGVRGESYVVVSLYEQTDNNGLLPSNQGLSAAYKAEADITTSYLESSLNIQLDHSQPSSAQGPDYPLFQNAPTDTWSVTQQITSMTCPTAYVWVTGGADFSTANDMYNSLAVSAC